MFRKLRQGQAMIFVMTKPEEIHLHMFFVFFPIDAVFAQLEADGSARVVSIQRDFKPFTTASSKGVADIVIELPAGAAQKLKSGDTLILVDTKTI